MIWAVTYFLGLAISFGIFMGSLKKEHGDNVPRDSESNMFAAAVVWPLFWIVYFVGNLYLKVTK
jgi:hypothetical protein